MICSPERADGYSYLHLVLIAGIILFAVGMRLATHHPGDPLASGPRLALCSGVALYLAVMCWLPVAHWLLALLRSSAHGRIVNVSTEAGLLASIATRSRQAIELGQERPARRTAAQTAADASASPSAGASERELDLKRRAWTSSKEACSARTTRVLASGSRPSVWLAAQGACGTTHAMSCLWTSNRVKAGSGLLMSNRGVRWGPGSPSRQPIS